MLNALFDTQDRSPRITSLPNAEVCTNACVSSFTSRKSESFRHRCDPYDLLHQFIESRMLPPGIQVGRASACELVVVSFAAHAQPVDRAPVASQEPGKHTQHAVELDDYAGPYEFLKSMPLTLVAQDGQLHERFGSGGFLKIEATGPDEYVVPKYLVYFTFRSTNGKISSVSVNHSDDFVGVKTAKPVPATAFSSDVSEERYEGIYTFVDDEDESEHAKAARELCGMKIYAKDGQLLVKQSARSCIH